MSYSVETTPRFDKEFKELEKYTQKMIKAWVVRNLVGCDDPRAHGKALTSNAANRWRYRIGDYRLICLIKDSKLIFLALTIGIKREAYEKTIIQSRKPAAMP